jgi:hypothetical protein
LLLPKFQSILEQGYVISNQSNTEIAELEEVIISSIDYFGVPKVDNIHLVYNGASCGLNKTVWAPHFWLPTPQLATPFLNYNYTILWSGFGPIGEMFLELPPTHAFSNTIRYPPFTIQGLIGLQPYIQQGILAPLGALLGGLKTQP